MHAAVTDSSSVLQSPIEILVKESVCRVQEHFDWLSIYYLNHKKFWDVARFKITGKGIWSRDSVSCQ